MKGISKILILIILVVVIVAGGLVYVFTSLDSIVAAAIRTYGTKVAQTEVDVSSVKIQLKQGLGSIKGLRISNPQGFSTPNAFTLGEISMDLDTSTITDEVIVVDRLLISRPHVTYEINDAKKANINVLKSNIEQFSSKSGKTAKKESEGKSVNILIRKFQAEGGQVDIHVPGRSGEPLSAKLPALELVNIGSGQGAAPGEIASQILSALIKNTGPAVAKAGIEKYLGQNIDAVKETVQKQVEEKAGKAVDDAKQKAGDALKNLLGK